MVAGNLPDDLDQHMKSSDPRFLGNLQVKARLQKQQITTLRAQLTEANIKLEAATKYGSDTHGLLVSTEDRLREAQTALEAEHTARAEEKEQLEMQLADAESTLWRIAPNTYTLQVEGVLCDVPDPFEGPGETYRAAWIRERTAREQAERGRDLAVAQMLMISSEIHADPKIDHAYSQGDARWTPTLRDAHSLRVRAEAAEARADDLQRQLNESRIDEKSAADSLAFRDEQLSATLNREAAALQRECDLQRQLDERNARANKHSMQRDTERQELQSSITNQQAEIERLREALEPFARECKRWDEMRAEDDMDLTVYIGEDDCAFAEFNVQNLRMARDLTQAHKPNGELRWRTSTQALSSTPAPTQDPRDEQIRALRDGVDAICKRAAELNCGEIRHMASALIFDTAAEKEVGK